MDIEENYGSYIKKQKQKNKAPKTEEELNRKHKRNKVDYSQERQRKRII